MPDDQLMLAYAQGDAAAFDVLYARHEGGLFRFVKRLLGARLVAQADEVFQDTWVRIISARDSFSPQGATWRTWAFTIAHNLAMDRLRVSGREVTLDAHPDDDSEPVPTLDRGVRGAVDAAAHPSAEELAFWRAAGRRLLACLDELPAEQRAAFLLHHEDGLDRRGAGREPGDWFRDRAQPPALWLAKTARLHGALSVGAGATGMSGTNTKFDDDNNGDLRDPRCAARWTMRPPAMPGPIRARATRS